MGQVMALGKVGDGMVEGQGGKGGGVAGGGPISGQRGPHAG